MKQERTPQEEAKRAASLSAVMTIAMLFLAIVLGRISVTQLQAGKIVSGCVSILGFLLFCTVGGIMLNDFRQKLASRRKSQEEPHE